MSAAVDLFASQATGLGSPYRDCALVTPSDSADLAYVTRGIMLGSSGTLQVTMIGNEEGSGETVEITGLATGVIHPICASRIWNTNTSASNICAFW